MEISKGKFIENIINSIDENGYDLWKLKSHFSINYKLDDLIAYELGVETKKFSDEEFNKAFKTKEDKEEARSTVSRINNRDLKNKVEKLVSNMLSTLRIMKVERDDYLNNPDCFAEIAAEIINSFSN
jgi:hypothetical protein